MSEAGLAKASAGVRESARAVPSDQIDQSSLYNLEYGDPKQELIDRTGVSDDELKQITQVMQALGELRDAEQRISEASRKYMKLNDTDMRALRYLMICANQGQVATPSGIARHLKISSASTTKLLDRLEKGGHILRSPHPADRRALAISVTPQTRDAAMQTVVKKQSRRYYAAARLTPQERDVVIRFLRDMTAELTGDNL